MLVIQEIFGVNQHMRNVADAYAAEGYAVLAPALFDRAERNFEVGYSPEDIAANLGQIRDTANYEIPDSIAGETKAIIEALKARG